MTTRARHIWLLLLLALAAPSPALSPGELETVVRLRGHRESDEGGRVHSKQKKPHMLARSDASLPLQADFSSDQSIIYYNFFLNVLALLGKKIALGQASQY